MEVLEKHAASAAIPVGNGYLPSAWQDDLRGSIAEMAALDALMPWAGDGFFPFDDDELF